MSVRRWLTAAVCLLFVQSLSFSADKVLQIAEGAERVPLEFEIDERDWNRLSPEEKQTLRQIIDDMSQRLYTYQSFPYQLPDTVFEDGEPIELSPFFHHEDAASDFEQSTRGDDGRQLRFSREQWRTIGRSGTFRVKSKAFSTSEEPRYYVCKLYTWLQTGSDTIKARLVRDVKHGRVEIFVYLPQRWVGKRLSLRSGLSNIFQSLRQVVHSVVSLPLRERAHSIGEIRKMLAKERDSFLASIEVGKEQSLKSYQRLFNRELMGQAHEILEKVDVRVKEQFREEALSLRRQFEQQVRDNDPDNNLTDQEILQEVADLMGGALRERRLSAIENCQELNDLSPGLAALMVRHYHGLERLGELENKIREVYAAQEAGIRQETWRWFRSDAQFERVVEKKMIRYWQDNVWKWYREAQQTLHAENFHELAYFLDFTIQHYQSGGPAAQNRKLTNERRAARDPFVHPFRRWNPVVVNDRQERPAYFDYSRRVEVRSDVPGFRWANFALRMGTFWSYSLHWALKTNLVDGPLGFRSLFGSQPFTTRDKIADGRVVPDEKSTRQTLWSMNGKLRAYLQHLRDRFKERKKFWPFPRWMWATGRFVKDEVFLRLVLGGALWVGKPALTLANVPFTLAANILSIVGSPVASALCTATSMAVWDFEGAQEGKYRSAFPLLGAGIQLAIPGVAQAVLMPTVGTGWHLTAGVGSILGSGIYNGAHTAWDFAARQFIWLVSNRLPPGDVTGVVYRTSGPGTSSGHYYELPPEVAVTVALVAMEKYEIDQWNAQISSELSAPKDLVERYVSVLNLITGGSARNSPAIEAVVQKHEPFANAINQAIETREDVLNNIIDGIAVDLSKMEKDELDLAITHIAAIAEQFYTKRVFPIWDNDTVKIDEFWTQQGLSPDNWKGLAEKLLSGVLGSNVLRPIEETDREFRIDIEPVGLGEQIDSILGANDLPTREQIIGTEPSVIGSPLPESRIPQISVSTLCSSELINQGGIDRALEGTAQSD